MATGGKPYYLAGLLPLLLAAGAVAATARHFRLAVLAVVLSAAPALVISLPVLPAPDADAVVAVNEDVGETIGWPSFVRTVAGVTARRPRR